MIVHIEYFATVGMDKPGWVSVVDETYHSRCVVGACKVVFEAVQTAENVENNLK